MKITKPVVFSALPFVFFFFFQERWSARLQNPDSSLLVAGVFFAAAVLLVLAQMAMRDRLLFPRVIAGVIGAIFISALVLRAKEIEDSSAIPVVASVLKNPSLLLYLSLFAMEVFPQMSGREPFTVYFAKLTTDKAFWKTDLFRAVNVRISFFWGIIFLLSFGAQFLPYVPARIAVPLVLQLAVGAPFTGTLIRYFQKRLAHRERGRTQLASSLDALKGIAVVYDRTAAKGKSTVLQFVITGKENFSAYLQLRNGACSFHNGIHPAPAMTVTSDAELWLKISRGEESGAAAYLRKEFTVSGDQSLLQLFSEMTRPVNTDRKTPQKSEAGCGEYFYSEIPHKVRKVLVIAGSPRGAGSKSSLLAEAFAEGCRGAGAEVEFIDLSDKKISHCCGCFTCWTKTPGVCIINDDAAGIYQKEDDADLVVYSFPLYHYGINSLLKKYIERSLPRVLPYLATDARGVTYHPRRNPDQRNRYAVVIGAAGFPEVSHFAAASHNFRMLADSTDDAMRLVAELYRPGAELLGVPFYAAENKRVFSLMKDAGIAVCTKGKIDASVAEKIGEVLIDRAEFNRGANAAWDECIARKKTLSEIIKTLAGS